MNAVTRHACMFAAPLDTALVLMDADGRIWAANRSACLLLGWHRGELWHTPIRGMDLRVRADFAQALRHAPCTLRLRVRGGRTLWLDCAPLEPRFFVCTLYEDQWTALVKEGVEACAHDIKTELTCAMGTVQILQMTEQFDSDCTQKLVRLRRFCQSAAMMAEQLCRDIRLLDPTRDEHEATSDCRTTLCDIHEDCRLLAQDKGISMTLSCSEERLFIWGGEQKLRRILMNFVSNALKFTPSGGSIDLSLERRHVHGRFFVEILVRDSGIGIPADRLPKRGRRYAPRSGIPGEGTGLGLSIVQTLVKNLRGQLWIESEPGQGTTIRLRFPEHPGQAPR